MIQIARSRVAEVEPIGPSGLALLHLHGPDGRALNILLTFERAVEAASWIGHHGALLDLRAWTRLVRSF